MIHDIVLPWPIKNIDTNFNLKDVLGDSIILNITVDGIDLSEYKIRCQIADYSTVIKLANTLAGGSDSQIVATEVESGMSGFQIIVPAGSTTNCLNYVNVEVNIEDETGIEFTILLQQMNLLDRNIDWVVPT